MLRSVIVAIVTRCTRHAWTVIVIASLLALASGVYAAKHFGINTDINTLISQDLPWRQFLFRGLELKKLKATVAGGERRQDSVGAGLGAISEGSTRGL